MEDLGWNILLVHNLYLGNMQDQSSSYPIRSSICSLICELHLLPHEHRAATERGFDLLSRKLSPTELGAPARSVWLTARALLVLPLTIPACLHQSANHTS